MIVARACEALALAEREAHALFQAFETGVRIQVQEFKLNLNPPRVEISNLDVPRGRGYETLFKDLGFQSVSASVWNGEWRKVPLNAPGPGLNARLDFVSTITGSITAP